LRRIIENSGTGQFLGGTRRECLRAAAGSPFAGALAVTTSLYCQLLNTNACYPTPHAYVEILLATYYTYDRTGCTLALHVLLTPVLSTLEELPIDCTCIVVVNSRLVCVTKKIECALTFQ
jgi:hypothetical protein